MKKLLVLILILCPFLAFGQYVNPTPDYQFKGQVSVGTDTDSYVPSPTSSWLTVGPDSTNKGMVLPRVVDTSDIASPVIGMTVYQYTDGAIYLYAGKWIKVGTGADGTASQYINGLGIATSTVPGYWEFTGNNAFGMSAGFYNSMVLDVNGNGNAGINLSNFNFWGNLYNDGSTILSTNAQPSFNSDLWSQYWSSLHSSLLKISNDGNLYLYSAVPGKESGTFSSFWGTPKYIPTIDTIKSSFIQNQKSSKQDAYAWFKTLRLDSLGINKNASTLLDIGWNSSKFKWDGTLLTVSDTASNLNIGQDAGFENTAVKDSQRIAIGTSALYGSKGPYQIAIGNQSLRFMDSSNVYNIGIGNNAAYYARFGQNTIIGSYAKNDTGALHKSYILDSTQISLSTQNYSGSEVALLISDNGLSSGESRKAFIDYSSMSAIPTYNQAFNSTDTSFLTYVTVLNSNTIKVNFYSYSFSFTFASQGNGRFKIVLFDSLSNVNVLGHNAYPDESNQVALGNNQITQIKFGGSGNIKLATDITPLDSSTLQWDSASGQYKPGIIPSSQSALTDTAASIRLALPVYGTFTGSGTDTTKTFTVTTSVSWTPSQILITSTSEDAANALFYVSSKSAGSFTITSVGTGPPPGTNNVTVDYELIK